MPDAQDNGSASNHPLRQESEASSGASISRRGFLKGAGLTAAGTALVDGVHAFGQPGASVNRSDSTELGPGPVSLILNVNGRSHAIQVEPRTTLVDALRIHLNLTGTKVVCDRGACSGCTVWLDKVPINSCMTLAIDAIGKDIITIEGLSPHPLQAAFARHDAMQCGFCTPGMVMSCAALLNKNPQPSEREIRNAIAGNLCRCGTYPRIFSATLEAARNTAKG